MVNEHFSDELVEDVLIEGPIHKTMLVFQRAEGWTGGRAIATAAFLSASLALLWSWVTNSVLVGLLVLMVHILLVGVDTAVLITLPKKKISFGPWKAQLFALLVPRWLATAVLVLLPFWINYRWALLVALIVQLSITAAYLWGLIIEIHRLRLTHRTLEIAGFKGVGSPIRLLHITDLHIERLTRREAEVMRIVRESAPDIIVMTGDYVNLSYNQDPTTYAQVRRLLGQLSAPYGVYATLGSPPVDLREEVVPLFEGLDICLMRRDTAIIQFAPNRELILLGLDCTHHLPTDRQRLARLVAKASDHAPRLLLYHSPELMPEAMRHGLDLYLCGHTHGGQVRLPFIGPLLTSSQLGRRYVMGLYQEEGTHLYVSRGIGLEGLSAPRVRFLAPPEMTLITIVGENSP